MLEYQERSGVVKLVETTVLSFTNTESIRYLNLVNVEGNARSEWTIYKNLSPIHRARTSVSSQSRDLNFYRYQLDIDDIIDVKVIHYEDSLAEFSSTLNIE